MTLSAPINPQNMVPNSCEVFVGYDWDKMFQLGFYKDPSSEFGGENADDNYANGTLKKSTGANKMKFSFSQHENTPEVRAILQNGLLTLSSPAIVSDEVLSLFPGNWNFDKSVFLKYANADGTPINPTITANIEGTETPLVKDTDFTTFQTSTKKTCVKFKTGGVLNNDNLQHASISIEYSATVDPSIKYFDHPENAIAKPFVMLVKNKWNYNGKDLGINQYLDNCLSIKSYLVQINDSDNTTAGFPYEITGEIINEEYIGFGNSVE